MTAGDGSGDGDGDEAGQLAEVRRLLEGTPYELRTLLGNGGMGEVYLVEHSFLGRQFALKVLARAVVHVEGYVERLRLEAHALGQIHHPNVVEITDFWIAQGRPCFVMELLEGSTLAAALRRQRRLPAERAVDYAVQALSALAAAHTVGLVHRDIKPENLYLHQLGGVGEPVIKVLDFGFARLLPNETLPPSVRLPYTTAGRVVGSLPYMAPEGLRGERVDHRADLFSLGLILYVSLTGTHPLDLGTLDNVVPPSRFADDIPAEIDPIVLRAIATKPDRRYQSAPDFLEDLRKVARKPSRSRGAW